MTNLAGVNVTDPGTTSHRTNPNDGSEREPSPAQTCQRPPAPPCGAHPIRRTPDTGTYSTHPLACASSSFFSVAR